MKTDSPLAGNVGIMFAALAERTASASIEGGADGLEGCPTVPPRHSATHSATHSASHKPSISRISDLIFGSS